MYHWFIPVSSHGAGLFISHFKIQIQKKEKCNNFDKMYVHTFQEQIMFLSKTLNIEHCNISEKSESNKQCQQSNNYQFIRVFQF